MRKGATAFFLMIVFGIFMFVMLLIAFFGASQSVEMNFNAQMHYNDRAFESLLGSYQFLEMNDRRKLVGLIPIDSSQCSNIRHEPYFKEIMNREHKFQVFKEEGDSYNELCSGVSDHGDQGVFTTNLYVASPRTKPVVQSVTLGDRQS